MCIESEDSLRIKAIEYLKLNNSTITEEKILFNMKLIKHLRTMSSLRETEKEVDHVNEYYPKVYPDYIFIRQKIEDLALSIIYNCNDYYGQRSQGDYYEFELKRKCKDFFKDEYEKERGVKSIEDFTISKIYFDVKTTDLYKKFNMPNLTSIDKIKKELVEMDRNLIYIFIYYSSLYKKIERVITRNLYEIPWSYITYSQNGKGQLLLLSNKYHKESYPICPCKKEWLKLFKSSVISYKNQDIIKATLSKNHWENWNYELYI